MIPMKHIFMSLMAMFLVGIFPCMGQTSLFRLKQYYNNESYQVYVGKTVVFYEPVNKDEKKIRIKDITIGKPYTIQNIRYREGNSIVDPMLFLSVTDNENANAHLITLKCTPSLIDKIPMYFLGDFENWKDEYVGTVVAYPDEPRVVTDLVWEKVEVLNDYFIIKPYVIYQGNLTQNEYKEPLNSVLKQESVIELSHVEKPADETIRYGETAVIQGEQVTKYFYVDNVISLLLYGSDKGFYIELENISENSIRLVWNEAVFVNVKGTTCRVIHNGINPDVPSVDQTPSLIIKGAKLIDTAVPTDLEYDIYRKRIVRDLYPSKFEEKGKVSLMLPIQIKDTINEYIFVFDVMSRWVHPELHPKNIYNDLLYL